MTTQALPPRIPRRASLVTRSIVREALVDALVKLLPQHQWRNPVMFVVYLGSILTTILYVQALGGQGEAPAGFILAVTIWLWFTVLFANFAEAVAEGRSKAQAAALRSAKRDTMAKKLDRPERTSAQSKVPSTSLRKGDMFLVEAGDFIPADGEVIEGVASVDESAITGESAPVIRESGGDFLLGDRRHARALRLARRARDGEPRRGVPRPHDRDGRERAPPEDAERDRADHPARQADDRLSARDGDAAAVLDLCAWSLRSRATR